MEIWGCRRRVSETEEEREMAKEWIDYFSRTIWSKDLDIIRYNFSQFIQLCIHESIHSSLHILRIFIYKMYSCRLNHMKLFTFDCFNLKMVISYDTKPISLSVCWISSVIRCYNDKKHETSKFLENKMIIALYKWIW